MVLHVCIARINRFIYSVVWENLKNMPSEKIRDKDHIFYMIPFMEMSRKGKISRGRRQISGCLHPGLRWGGATHEHEASFQDNGNILKLV
jgi:hypothetical protein